LLSVGYCSAVPRCFIFSISGVWDNEEWQQQSSPNSHNLTGSLKILQPCAMPPKTSVWKVGWGGYRTINRYYNSY
jgi:hypothetical protein